jgi:hypothetical protein
MDRATADSIIAMIDEYIAKNPQTIQALRSDTEFLISVNTAHPSTCACFDTYAEVDEHYFGNSGGFWRRPFGFPLENQTVLIPVKKEIENSVLDESGQHRFPFVVKDSFFFTMNV